MADFPHLRLTADLSAQHRTRQAFDPNRQRNPKTVQNLGNRGAHAAALQKQLAEARTFWQEISRNRQNQGLPIPTALPVFLEIDADELDVESLYGFGIEVISVEERGLIIGAAADQDFLTLNAKIQRFLDEQGRDKDQAARLWRIETGEPWRLSELLAPELAQKWSELSPTTEYIIDISISCHVKIPEMPLKQNAESDDQYHKRLDRWQKRGKADRRPIQKIGETETDYQVRYARWLEEKNRLDLHRDELLSHRQEIFQNLLEGYGGRLLDSYVDCVDSFSTRIAVNGTGLKDIVLTFPYVFEVSEYDPYTVFSGDASPPFENNLDFTPPKSNAARVCIIDSGIQQNHRLIQDAIDVTNSRSYIPGDPSTADAVNGGHGTRVAGAVLFANRIPTSGRHEHIAWLLNARVLSALNGLPTSLYPPRLINEICSDFDACRLFNLSLTTNRACRSRHMSAFGAALDALTWEKDILFLVAAGNIMRENGNLSNPGVRNFLRSNHDYPEYFTESAARIANPSQSAFSLTVGSICSSELDSVDWVSFGKTAEPSAFSRSGPGLWGMIKPEVVEYGGDYVRERNLNPNVRTAPETSIETIRATTDGTPAVGRDAVGTSYSTPKVTHIAAQLLNQWPLASTNFLRALIIQSARWPQTNFSNIPTRAISLYGYGLPNLTRCLGNSEQRITFVAENTIQPRHAHVYKVAIPPSLRNQADSFSYRIEVTLTYKARVRRTRRTTKSYLSTWLDWLSSKLGEDDIAFQERATTYAGTDSTAAQVEDTSPIPWVIREQANWGEVRGLKRNDSTSQKDWVILKSYELPEFLSIAVVGHRGWEQNLLKENVPYCLMISIECLEPQIEIYNSIRLHNRIEVEV